MVGSPLHVPGVTLPAMMSRTMSAGMPPPASLLRAQAPILPPSRASVGPSDARSVQVAVSPCGEEDLPDVLSAPPSLRAWTPPPAARGVHRPVSSSTTSAFPSCGPGRRSAKPVQRLQYGALCEAASHCFMFRPAGVLATQSAPPDTAATGWQPCRFHPSLSRFVPSPCPGYAHRLHRAIDGMGTCTPSDAQPCRLLPERWTTLPPSGPEPAVARRQPARAAYSTAVAAPSTTCLNVWLGVKRTTRRATMQAAAPVLGLRPTRARLART